MLLVSCEQQCLRYRDKQEALFKASNHIYFMSMFVASIPLCCPSHTVSFSSPERRGICVQGTVAVLESDVVGSHCIKKGFTEGQYRVLILVQRGLKEHIQGNMLV